MDRPGPVSNTTSLYPLHCELNAKIVEFANYQMPLNYPTGIIKEHHHVRESAGLFDVSHMGQIKVIGDGATFFFLSLLYSTKASPAVFFFFFFFALVFFVVIYLFIHSFMHIVFRVELSSVLCEVCDYSVMSKVTRAYPLLVWGVTLGLPTS